MKNIIKYILEKKEIIITVISLIILIIITNFLTYYIINDFNQNIISAFTTTNVLILIFGSLAFFLLSIIPNNKISNILIILTGILFGIDRYFASIYKDYFFHIGLSEKNLNMLFSFSQLKDIISDYISIETFIYIFIYATSFIIYFFSLKFLINKMINKEILKQIYQEQKIYIIIFIVFLFMQQILKTNILTTPFLFRTYYVTIETINHQLFPIKRKNIFFDKYKQNNTNIILVMDESVQYEYFDFNKLNFKYIKQSPMLVTGDCSYISNSDLITGLKIRKNKNSSTIFQYSKNAQYNNYIINAQSSVYTNGLNYKDSKYINKYIFINGKRNTKDKRILTELKKIYSINKAKKFIFLQKYGAHFKYSNNIIKEKRTKNREKNYIENIKEGSIDFLNELNKIIKDTNTKVYYLSDHGQNINFIKDLKGEKEEVSHCNSNIYSYKVPSIIFGNIENINLQKQKYYYEIDIFSEILKDFGYKEMDIKKYYPYKTKELKDFKIFNMDGTKKSMINI